ncbi:MAG: FAD-dependent oxidoreductase [Myxococcota bacterium]
MTRKDFLRLCSILGVGIPGLPWLGGCGDETGEGDGGFSGGGSGSGSGGDANVEGRGHVLILGAGVGGLSAAYTLQRMGVDFTILEASNTYGGRVKIDRDFADFPIPLGAEWIETGTGFLEELVDDPGVEVDVATFPDGQDHKFRGSSWLQFFEQFILPSVDDRIRYGERVTSVNYEGDIVEVTTDQGVHLAERVIVSVPLRILQVGDIGFQPALPSWKREAIDGVPVWDGFKAFFEFSENFYESGPGVVDPVADAGGQKLYYDAAWGQNSSRHVLGLFTVGEPARDYTERSGDELRDFILAELDAAFEGRATATYLNHVVQDWGDEPLAKGAYLADNADYEVVQQLGRPVANKLFFGGGAYTDGEDWVSVHVAARSGRDAAVRLVS